MASVRTAAAFAALILGLTGTASSDPLTSRTEDVEVTAIDGSIQADAGSGGPIIIQYEIRLTRATGRYLAGTAHTPGTEYRRVKACISFSADFFADSGCTKRVTFALAADLGTSTGSFKARMRQNAVTVRVSFSVKATGAASDQPALSYGASQTSMSAEATAGRWTARKGRARGWFEWPGYPRASIDGAANLSRGTLVGAGADL